ncbi:MAG TPA: T9SS type A sorting domain-containing protein [Salinivirga sp.]|uniref:T9SS type A sorting domain-containing protein n=1 Tax=Salinivirga sp. TaxID=1970192 RepID=UPI002B4A4F51|nr:T9SS type A sorting domain-containing protein [Salinivirga sp.]HKK60363.1 T9SS type A sorting domain-containing protein [Salinivirga sp.]
MRKIYLLIIFLISGIALNAQSFELQISDSQELVNNGDTIHVNGGADENPIASHFEIENISMGNITMQVSREDVALPEGMTTFFCVGTSCYLASTFISDEFVISAGETQIFDADLEPRGNTGDALIKYNLYTMPDSAEMLSFYVHFSVAPVGISENLLSEFMLYPNPVKGQLNVRYEGSADRNTRIEVYNALGKLMKARRVSPNTDYQINMDDFNTGLYMVKLVNAEGVLQTRKILKK